MDEDRSLTGAVCVCMSLSLGLPLILSVFRFLDTRLWEVRVSHMSKLFTRKKNSPIWSSLKYISKDRQKNIKRLSLSSFDKMIRDQEKGICMIFCLDKYNSSIFTLYIHQRYNHWCNIQHLNALTEKTPSNFVCGLSHFQRFQICQNPPCHLDLTRPIFCVNVPRLFSDKICKSKREQREEGNDEIIITK